MLATALVAPAAIASLALTAAPASAMPVRTFVVAGDAPSETGGGSGAWGFHGVDFDQVRNIITNAANFGSTGTVRTASFQIGTPVVIPSDATLANVDVFFSGAIAGGYTVAEEQALQRFVARGGMLIVNSNSAAFDTSDFLGFTVEAPEAIWEPGVHPGGSVEDAALATNLYAAPRRSVATGTHPIIQGPFGTVTNFQNWHTVTGFTTLPSSAQTLARINYDCTSGVAGYCEDPAAVPPYDQDLINLPTLAVIPPTISAGVRSGAVIATSDVDTFSDHTGYADPMLASNELLLKNVFAYIANQLTDGYVSLNAPTRIMSTRDGIGTTKAKLGVAGRRDLVVAGLAGIPANASAVVLNVTVDGPSEASYLSVFPTGSVASNATPPSSNLNFYAGQTIPNMVMVKLSAAGSITFWNEKGTVDVIADAIGYYVPGSGDRFIATPQPDRLLDTRDTNTPFVGDTPRALQVTGAGSSYVPAGATAVILNVTAAANDSGGFITVYPGNVSVTPDASNLNFVPGRIIANMVVAKLSPTGTINIMNKFGNAHVVVDVLGYFVNSSSGGSFGAVTPDRILDTRTGVGGVPVGTVGTNGFVAVSVLGVKGVPSTNVRAVLLNVTAAGPTLDTVVTVWPEGTKPLASNLNPTAPENIPNLVVVKVGADGKVRLGNVNGNVHLIADVVGYFS